MRPAQRVCLLSTPDSAPQTLHVYWHPLPNPWSPTVESILTAYSISEKVEKDEMIDKVLKLAADIMFCKPAQDHAAKWREQGNVVQQYIFEQKQPFGGIYQGKATHSLDLAYLHGDPEVFSGTADPEGEVKVQRAMQDAWINFAQGGEGEGWGKGGLVRRFGPGGVVDESVETVVKKWNRGDAWKSWETLGAEQLNALVGLSALFIGGFIGFENP